MNDTENIPPLPPQPAQQPTAVLPPRPSAPVPPQAGGAPTPPPGFGGAPVTGPAPQPAGGGAAKAVAILTGVVGGIVLLLTTMTAVFSGYSGIVFGWAGSAGGSDAVNDVLTASVSGVESLDVEAAAAAFTIEFADVSEARLELTDARGDWSLSRDGDALVVDGPSRIFDFGWFDDVTGTVRLMLPESLERSGIDADLTLLAGSFDATGSFRELEADVNAGELVLNGSADSLQLRMSAGSADIDLADVRTASFDVSAGYVEGRLSGEAPDELGVDLSAGYLELEVPSADYAVESDVAVGDFDNRLDTSRDSAHRVTVEVSAGEAVLRSAD